ncbi:MAG: T9SS type A sorting domain-containing protein [Microscillaceae bacterium]|nr:T9SS type A sorting domain-containing protein [Microscillaceae bacterium]
MMLLIMKKNFYGLFVIIFLVCVCSFLPSQAQERGKLLSSQLVAVKTVGEIDNLIEQTLGGGLGATIAKLFLPTYYDVAAYKLVYETIDPLGNPTQATGAVFIPLGINCDLAMTTYLHGTLTADRDAPSGFAGIESVIGFALATDAYITVMPDYLGLGENNGQGLSYHPYQHAKSEATASVDMMRAARVLCAQQNLKLNGQVFLTGYSQGAHATLATQREIERFHKNEFNLSYVTAGSGPYDLYSKQTKFVFANPTYTNPSFLPYILFGYQNIYGGIYNNISEVLNDPFSVTVPPLFDGSLNVEQIDSMLPVQWKTIFKPAFLNDVENNSGGRLRLLLRENTVLGWRPRAQLRMYFCTKDELVDFQNSLTAWGDFVKRGALFNVAALPLGPFKHFDCAQYALLATKIKFDSKKKGKGCSSNFWDWWKNNEAPEFENQELVNLYLQNQAEVDAFVELVEEINAPTLEELLAQYDPQALEEFKSEQNPGISITSYPNPTTEEVTLDLSSLETPVKSVQVFDLQGASVQVLSETVGEDFMILDFRNLKKGFYIIKVTTEAGTYQNKVIVH